MLRDYYCCQAKLHLHAFRILSFSKPASRLVSHTFYHDTRDADAQSSVELSHAAVGVADSQAFLMTWRAGWILLRQHKVQPLLILRISTVLAAQRVCAGKQFFSKPISALIHARCKSSAATSLPQLERHVSRPRLNDPSHNILHDEPGPSSQRRDKIAYWFYSLFGFSFALYLSYLAIRVRSGWLRSQRLAIPQDADVSNRWDDFARDYDDEIDLAERFMGMLYKRRRLVAKARGDVLEVSVGTGRNMQHYDLRPFDPTDPTAKRESRITRVTFNDKATVMVEKAEEKFWEMEARKIAKEQFRGQVAFVEGDATVPGVLKRPGEGYDTIVQTMGVCSMTDPVAGLKRFGELIKKPKRSPETSEASKDDKRHGKSKKVRQQEDSGRILLLEHGRGHYDWTNRLLDGLAASHADHYGCWWNRDVEAIVKESGLEIESIRRYHLGTTWEVICKPKYEMPEEQVKQSRSDSSWTNWIPGLR